MNVLSNRFSKLSAVFGAGALLALAGCREKPKQWEHVTANIGVREFTDFSTKKLPSRRDTVAPDGSDVRLLLGLKKGSMIHFEVCTEAFEVFLRAVQTLLRCVVRSAWLRGEHKKGSPWHRPGAFLS